LVDLPADRAVVTFFRLLIVTMSLSAAAWPQFFSENFLAISGPTVAISGKHCEIGPKLLLITNKKSHIGFQMT